MTALPGVSIVVNNYNLARYLGVAIESALAQDHPDVEVIVVDDASNDGSREVIARYKGRVRAVLRESNGHQLAALNGAWPLARHPILMFLDADDALLPHAASTVARAWMPSTAKVQFCLASIDAAGRSLGHIAPKYPPRLDTATIRAELLRTGSAPSAQGSGNAYARWLLDRLAADGGLVPGGVFWMDAILEVNAPFYGEVVTLAEPLVYYRMHDSNWTQQDDLATSRFTRMTEFFDRKLTYLAGRCRQWGIVFHPDAVRDRSLWYAEYRLAAARLTATGKAAFESPFALLGPALRACASSPFSLRQKLARGAWLVLVAWTPRLLAARLIEARFVVATRPAWLERLFDSRQVGQAGGGLPPSPALMIGARPVSGSRVPPLRRN
jgi:glycosyltransferase involved in cell wall biosynthesis